MGGKSTEPHHTNAGKPPISAQVYKLSPHGTRGQKVRHLPGGSSDLIHRYFCPLGRRRKHIHCQFIYLRKRIYLFPLIIAISG